ncbi:MAG: DUF3379 domain-containing protein [bacterium]|nr:DUF3379 domain-containing protein [bacterium]
MKKICRKVQQTLAEQGPGALRADEAAQRHLEECADCFQMLDTVAGLNGALDELPDLDAPDEVVERLLARPELTAPAAVPPSPRVGRRVLGALPRRTWAMAAVSVVLALAIAFMLKTRLQRPQDAWSARKAYVEVQEEAQAPDVAMSREDVSRLAAVGYVGGTVEGEAAPPAETKADGRQRLSSADEAAPTVFGDQLVELGDRDAKGFEPREQIDDFRYGEDSAAELEEDIARVTESKKRKREAPKPFSVGKELREAERGSFNEAVGKDLDGFASDDDLVAMDKIRKPQSSLGLGRKSESTVGGRVDRPNLPSAPQFQAEVPVQPAPAPEETRVVQEFLHQRSSIDGLRFQPAIGYWANTYVPGDPVLRYLEARLLERDPGVLQRYSGDPLRLHAAARQTTQPFDPPEHAALAVFLHADRRALAGETRLLVQVGLQGTPRYSGRRPAMNVGVVLDLRGEVPAETAAAMRALVAAFGQAKDVGDQFRLIVAGRPGGVAVEPAEFRHGPLMVAMQRFFAGGGGTEGDGLASPLSLVEAVAHATEVVRLSDDPTTPLGSSVVILLTGQALGSATEELARIAHRSAVAGVPLSVVGVGGEVRLPELDRLALTGQGNRRLLQAPREAAGLVDRELSAVGRVIARAVRLRIRLAPGVRLIDVLDSRRLDEVHAQRVRQAERSIDQRLSRNLGIRADRGEDEEGIQIVIPSFYAGSAHVILLDAVAGGPGPIADVTVRYKDLVHLRNGVARAHLSLGRGHEARGPLERNVLKNLLAQQLREALESSGQSLAAGRGDDAVRRLTRIRALLAGLTSAVPGFDKDRDVARDVAMLDEYLTLLDSVAGGPPEPREHLAESLRYAGRLKVLPRPGKDG